jgi:hypothetical protein
LEEVDQVKSEIALEANAEAEGKVGLFWFSTKLLARLKSIVVGNREQRKVIRQKLQSRSTELVDRVNLLLDNAHEVLERHQRPANLLIVVDNLDRLEQKATESLFFKDGDRLKLPRAHLIYTVPVATVVAPRNTGMVFENAFTLPMVSVRNRQGKRVKEGLDALVRLVGERIDLDAVFASRQVLSRLAELSGGNVRDLMRPINNAQLSARVAEKETIDTAAVKRATTKIRLDFERMLIPGQVYYPLLAEIHKTKGDQFTTNTEADAEKVHNLRVFFTEFLFNGSVLEYNGDAMWYDVHPIIQEIERFREAVQHVESQEDAPGAG